MKLLSILVPTYNRFDLTKNLVSSLTDQIKKDQLEELVEIIVCDNSTNIIEKNQLSEFVNTLGSVVEFYDTGENIGPTQNWKECVNVSRGEYSLYVFSDDAIYAGGLHLLIEELIKSKPDLVFFSTKIGSTLDDAILFRDPTSLKKYSKTTFLKRFLLNGEISHSPATYVFKKTLLTYDNLDIILSKFNGALKFGAGSDVLFCFNIFFNSNFEKISYVNEAIAFFRDHPNSFTSSIDTNFYVSKHTIQTKIYLAKVHFGISFFCRAFLAHQINFTNLKRRMFLWQN